jgi:hypothetical protein
MHKAELLDWLQTEIQRFEALLDEIGPARLDAPGVNGDWSVKDLVAHLAGWQPRLNASLQAAQRGEPAPPPPWPARLQADDEVNAWIYAANHARSVAEVRADARRVWQQTLAVVAALPEDVRIEVLNLDGRLYHLVCLGEQKFPIGEFLYHFRDDHSADLRAWRARVEHQ